MTTDQIIDAHVHVWTPNVASYPLAAGYSNVQIRPTSFTPEEFLAIAQPLGVRRTVLVQMDFYGFDNSYLLDVIQQFRGVFSGVAQVDEHGADPAKELRRLKAFGVRGLRITPPSSGNPEWLDDPGMQALWRCGMSEQIAICPIIDAADIPAIARMCQIFPETTVVVDHCAGIGSDGIFREADLQSLCELAKFSQAHVKISAFYHMGQKRPPYTDLIPMIRRLLDAYGPERLMWGSDSPFQQFAPNSYQDSLDFVYKQLGFISSGDRQWLLQRTAEKVFFQC